MSKKDKYSSLLSKKNSSAEKNEAYVSEAHSSLFQQEEKKEINSATRKKKFEEKYKRATYYIENDIKEKLDKQAGNEKGEKTRIVNEALRNFLR